MENLQGWLPGLISWWEGLYGWLVLILSTLISVGILGMIYYSSSSLASLYFFLSSWDKAKHLFTVPSIAWIIIAACFYQFEFVVRRHFMALVLQTLNFATWGFGGEAPKKGWNPFTPFKTYVLLY